MTDPTARLLRTTRRRLFVVTLGARSPCSSSGSARRRRSSACARSTPTSTEPWPRASRPRSAALDGELPQAQRRSPTTDESVAGLRRHVPALPRRDRRRWSPTRRGSALAGLPDAGRGRRPRRPGRDLRTVDAGGVAVRLLTVPVVLVDGRAAGRLRPGRLRPDAPRRAVEQPGRRDRARRRRRPARGGGGHAGRHRRCARSRSGGRSTPSGGSSPTPRTSCGRRPRSSGPMPRSSSARGSSPTTAARSSATSSPRPTDSARLVGDLLQLASADATGLVLERQPVDLAAIAADTVRQAEALAAERGVSLRMVGVRRRRRDRRLGRPGPARSSSC